MTENLNARKLQITVTRKTAPTSTTGGTIHYTLAANGQAEKWVVPLESQFDLSMLEEGKRYDVWTRTIRSLQWDYKAQNRIWKDRYDWTYAEERSPKARITAKPKPLNQPPLADNGDLFKW